MSENQEVVSAKEKAPTQTVGKLRSAYAIAVNYQKIPSRFGWACLRAVEKIDSAIKKQQKEVEDKQRELALLYTDGDKKGSFITGENSQLVHTADSLKKIDDLIEKQKDIEVEYEPYYATDFSEIKGNLVALNLVNGIIIESIDLEQYVNPK